MDAWTIAGHLLAARDDDEGCGPNDYDGRLGVRISSIFVILVGGAFGACFPTFAVRHQGIGIPSWVFFIAKFFGSGVILATAFIHLLAPATDALTNPCLTGPITEYDWAEGIALMTIFVLFFVELMVMRYGNFGKPHTHDFESHPPAHTHNSGKQIDTDVFESKNKSVDEEHPLEGTASSSTAAGNRRGSSHVPGDDHFGHSRDHPADPKLARVQSHESEVFDIEDYAAQILGIFILEFGVIFHSIFIGLTLAVTGDGFNTLYVVLVFHQTFEGFGLGSRLASVDWPKSKQWTPYFLGMGYAISTPIAIAIGLGVRKSFSANHATTLLTNGIFDSISAGILIYTALVELMAHEFMFSPYMQRAPIKVVLSALLCMALGTGLMALLGKWA